MPRPLFEATIQPPLPGFESTFLEAHILAVACLED